ncbi:MAG TPA: heparan-alpha-glucosaminide N-acetyltransferase domain-containing protein [Geobacteraceae bacterium]
MNRDDDKRAYRLTSIDMLRGLAIVLMAIDHVRDFCYCGAEQDPMANPNISVGLFATRWITHFCAPVFVLLAGTSAGLMATRKSGAELARFLFTRGLWLIFVEWFIVSTSWSFSPGGIPQLGGRIFVVLQVIWAIGAGMVVLAGLQFLGRRACLAIGVAIVAGHNLLDGVWPAGAPFQEGLPPWVALHSQMALSIGPFFLTVIYPFLAWVGVIALGFGLAGLFELPPERRNKVLLRAGTAMTVAFLVLRGFDMYGDPNPWHVHPGNMTATVIDFLNTTKYPPSLAFLLMTLGPAALLCAVADRITGRVKDALVMFGRVPFGFYVPHFFLIHALSMLLGVIQGYEAGQFMTVFFYYPKGYGLGLPGVYALWILVVALLYPFCRWYAAVKARRRDWWLSYL